MAVAHVLGILLLIKCLCLLQLVSCLEVRKFPLHMPNIHPNSDELYVCTPVKIVPEKSFYIVGFEPNATMSVVHHMLVFGCTVPGTFDETWDCGEMAAPGENSNLRRASPCSEGSHVLYAWARNAKKLELPEDVGFQVGNGTEIRYMVLQIHYSKKFPGDERDNSGLNLLYTEEPQSKLAGVLLLGVGGLIPRNSVTKMDAVCTISEYKTIHPFAYRVHTHSLGKVVSGYSIRRDKNGVDHWTLLGKRDPLTPQMFYPVFDRSPISFGDRVASRCTMNSMLRDRITKIGPTNDDEMCNFYIMYYVDNGTPLNMRYCTDPGPPKDWSNLDDLNNIPQDE